MREIVLTLGILLSVPPASAAEICPSASTSQNGFVVERGEAAKTETFYVDREVVRTLWRSRGSPILETTMFNGLFELERLEQGRRTLYKPRSDLTSFFPLAVGGRVNADFDVVDASGRKNSLSIALSVSDSDVLYVGGCKYSVLKIERNVAWNERPFQFTNFDYYSPDLKFILAKEYREKDGRTNMIKFDRINSAKR